jgi:hypothetical protein
MFIEEEVMMMKTMTHDVSYGFSNMTIAIKKRNKELFEWLDTCLSHKFEVIDADGNSVRVMVKPKGEVK